jgi:murein DD-endopeptidase MepM/ murein hydrolase activator NlpD
MSGVNCPKCACLVPLHEGQPNVTAVGTIELWHASCWAVRHARPVEVVAVIAPRSRVAQLTDRVVAMVPGGRWRYVASGAAAAMLAAIAVAPGRATAASAVPFDYADAQAVVIRQHLSAPDDPPPKIREPAYAVPVVDGVALDERYPSLLRWVHPVTSTVEKMPEQVSRHFGAERKGIERTECGAGHCGVDLDGPEGRPVVAVAEGTVVRVERHELGLDGRSGRYVRIEHDDGTLTAYMHLDDVARGLEPGDHVDGGQYIGTLGSTAVYAAAPHLHFSLEIPNVPGTHGDNTNTHYVDPAPFLVRASVAPMPERKHALKPAM